MFQAGLRGHCISLSLLVSLFGLSLSATAQQDAKSTSSDKAAPANTQAVDPLKRPLSEKQKKENAKALKQELSKTYKKWLDEDVVYIISDEERKAFKQLSNDEERDQFIEAFWQRRDPTPDTEENEFKEEHYRRIWYANQHFGTSARRGWQTDRGHIYIVCGPPDEIEAHPEKSPAKPYPSEVWTYRHVEGVEGSISFTFLDRERGGDYQLLGFKKPASND